MKARVSLRQQQRSLLFSALLILIVCCHTFAQSDTATGTRNTIQGDIVTPHGQRLDRPVMVWLSGNRGEVSTTSSGNGAPALGRR